MSEEEEKKERMDKEKKAFITEQTVVNKKLLRKRYGNRLLFVVVAAVLFGIISSFIFVLSARWLDSALPSKEDDKIKSQEEMENPTPSPEQTPEPTQPPVNPNQRKSEKNVNLRLRDIGKISGIMQTYAKEQMHSMVTVSMVQTGTDWFDNPSISKESTYGVILKKQNNKIYILTDTDILASGDKLQVTIEEENLVEAEVYASSKSLHLAVLEASVGGLEKGVRDSIAVAEFATAVVPDTSQILLLLGKPNGYLNSVEWGTVVTNQLEVALTDRKFCLYHLSVPQNKAGAGVVLNLERKITGVLTTEFEKEAGSEEAVMIGSRELWQDVERLLRGKSLHYFGIQGTDMTEEAIEELKAEAGVYVTEVEADSPAYKAGIRNGDVITSLGGEKITSIYELNGVLQSDIVDKAVTAKVIRTAGKHTGEMSLKISCSKLK